MKNYYKIDNKFNILQTSIKNNENTKKSKSNKNVFLDIASLNIGIYLITPLLLGVFIGYNIDRFLNRKPLFTILFIIIGSLSSFYNLIKFTKKN